MYYLHRNYTQEQKKGLFDFQNTEVLCSELNWREWTFVYLKNNKSVNLISDISRSIEQSVL